GQNGGDGGILYGNGGNGGFEDDAAVQSGVLNFAIDNLSCQWADGGDNVAPGDAIVPGDTMQCTGSSKVVTNIKGKNLKATLSAVPT
ncbi:hypothetical protein KC220_24525, partial [Mycobacterium tuberculosis]|nr:hypothetical protein [Mycobacterium tuberculosis]